MRNVFWVLALGIIAAYLFFFALGAFDALDVLPVSLVVLALTVAWIVHALLQGRHPEDFRDPRLIRARERRGF